MCCDHVVVGAQASKLIGLLERAPVAVIILQAIALIRTLSVSLYVTAARRAHRVNESLAVFTFLINGFGREISDCWFLGLLTAGVVLAAIIGPIFTLAAWWKLRFAAFPFTCGSTPEERAAETDGKCRLKCRRFPFCVAPTSSACARYTTYGACTLLLVAGAIASITIVSILLALRASSFAEQWSLELNGLASEVSIIREDNGNGVLRILAETESDALFAQGAVQAQTRLWQMDFQRRLVRGRLAELLGDAAVDVDKLFRTLQLGKAADHMYETASPRARAAAERYVEGVNAVIREYRNMIPGEYRLVGASKVERFKPADVFCVVAIISLQLSANADEELRRLAWAEVHNVPFARRSQMMPFYDTTEYPTILSAASAQLGTQNDLTGAGRYNASARSAEIADAMAAYTEMAGNGAHSGHRQLASDEEAEPLSEARATARSRLLKSILPLSHMASNNFVISGDLSKSGGAMLENDPHLAFSSPGVWQMVHVQARDTGYNAIGVSFPGAPGVVIGRTQHVAWGVTTSLNDAQDIFRINVTADGLGYWHNSHKLAFETSREVIKVDHGDDVVITTRRTIYGPVINENEGLEYFGGDKGLYLSEGFAEPLALGWSMLQESTVSGSLDAMINLGTATTWREVQEAFEGFTEPCQSFVFAFANGDIGYQVSGVVPNRANGHEGTYPVMGDGTYDWQGLIPFTGMPRTYNPPEGYVVTANNRVTHAGWSLNNQGMDWGNDAWRAKRIVEMINDFLATGDGKIDVSEMRAIQSDYRSLFDVEFRDIAINTIDPASLNTTGQALHELITDWDGVASAGSAATTAFHTWVRFIVRRISASAHREIYYNPFWLLSLAASDVTATDPACIDAGYATCTELMTSALDAAAVFLQEAPRGSDGQFPPHWGGKNPTNDFNTCAFSHNVLGGTLMDCAASQYAEGGGAIHSVSKGEFSYSDDHLTKRSGPSFRELVDFGDIGSSVFIAGPGQSGNLFSPRYGSNIEKLVEFTYYNYTLIPTDDETVHKATLSPDDNDDADDDEEEMDDDADHSH